MGARYGIRREKNCWDVTSMWRMLPSVMPIRRSMSAGVSSVKSRTRERKFGAYWDRISRWTSMISCFLAASHGPSLGWAG